MTMEVYGIAANTYVPHAREQISRQFPGYLVNWYHLTFLAQKVKINGCRQLGESYQVDHGALFKICAQSGQNE